MDTAIYRCNKCNAGLGCCCCNAGHYCCGSGLQGPTGPQGTPGPAGAPGPAGPQGAPGPAGAQGAAGVQGVAGPQGAAGAAGAQGSQGIPGPTGAQGAAGPAGVQGEPGPAGAQGPAGVTGPTGAAGPTGPTGAAGIAGATGPTGADGIDGVTGPTGPTGPMFVPQGTFFTFEEGPYGPEAIIPMTDASSTNTPAAFTITGDGRVRVLNAGVYLVDGHLQLAPGSSGVMGLQKNDEGLNTAYDTSGSFSSNDSVASGLISVNTVLLLSAGDTVSWKNTTSPQFTVELLGMIYNPDNPSAIPTSSSAGAIRLVRLSDI